MEGLERSLLDSSVLHNDDKDESSVWDNHDFAAAATDEEPDMRLALRSRSGEAVRTGPKGVLADWRASNKAHSTQQSALYEEEDASDRAAVERYRLQRMAELKSAGPYGHLREIGMEQFEQAVLGEEADVKVVLLLYEPDILGCTLLSQHLCSLARLYPRAKFLRARASELDFRVHDDVLPTLLIYQGGDLIGELFAVDRYWDQKPNIGEDTVKEVLQKHGVLAL